MASRKDGNRNVLRPGEHQRKKGYHYTYLEENIEDGTKKRKYIYAKTLEELRIKEAALEENKRNNVSMTGGNVTLNKMFEMMLDSKDLRASTKANYISMWNSFVREKIGTCSIKVISNSQLKIFYMNCSKDGLKSNTIKLLHNLIHSTLQFALGMKDEAGMQLIKDNQADGAMSNIKKNDATEKQALKRREIDSVLEFCDSSIYNVYSPFIRVAIGSCMRIGELTGLTWDDIDFENGKINVNRQLIYKNLGEGCKFYVTDLKTDTSARSIPMSDTVRKAFVELRKMDMLLGRRCNVEIDGYSNFIFLSKNGTPLATNAVNNFLLNIEKAYNKSHEEKIPHLSAHILRHTGCTMSAASGMDVKTLQYIMGHKSPDITMKIYNHIEKEDWENNKSIDLFKAINF